MARLIKADGTESEVLPKNPKEGFSLEELQGFVGGYIEVAIVVGDSMMICNEDGKRLMLPVNIAASAIHGRDVVVGDVLIASESEVR